MLGEITEKTYNQRPRKSFSMWLRRECESLTGDGRLAVFIPNLVAMAALKANEPRDPRPLDAFRASVAWVSLGFRFRR